MRKYVWTVMAVFLFYNDIAVALTNERDKTAAMMLPENDQRATTSQSDLLTLQIEEKLCDMFGVNQISEDYLKYKGVDITEFKQLCEIYEASKVDVMDERDNTVSPLVRETDQGTDTTTDERNESEDLDLLTLIIEEKLCDMFGAKQISEDYLKYKGVDITEFKQLCGVYEASKDDRMDERDNTISPLVREGTEEGTENTTGANQISEDYLNDNGVNIAEFKQLCRIYEESRGVIRELDQDMSSFTVNKPESISNVKKELSTTNAELCDLFSAGRISEEFLSFKTIDVDDFKQRCATIRRTSDSIILMAQEVNANFPSFSHASSTLEQTAALGDRPRLPLALELSASVSGNHASSVSSRCFDWQHYNGSHCICGNENSCSTHTGGYVCDDEGQDYPSQCDFQKQICNRKVSTLREMSVCTECMYLRLQGSSLFEEDPAYGMGIFKGVAETRGKDGKYTEYKAMDDSGFMVMMVPEWENWVIGKRNASGEFVAMKSYIAGGTTALEVSHGGFMVIRRHGNEDVWDVDPLLHFECITEKELALPQKRFFFIAFIVIAVAAVTVSTTLRIVQSARGCLYFPEVCTLRKEIEDTLKPRIERKKNAFNSNYGDAAVYKDIVLQCYTKTSTIRRGLVMIQELFDQLGEYTNNAFLSLKGIPTELLSGDFAYSLKVYEDYKKGVGKAAALSFVGLQIEVGLAAYSLATTTVTTAAVAFAAIGAAIAIFVAVADIISSILQEKKIRNTLRTNKAELLQGERDIDKATMGMIEFQKEICKELLVPLSKLAQAGAPLSNDFQNFMNMLVRHNTFVVTQEICNQHHMYSNIKFGFVATLNDWLQIILDHVQNDIEGLKCKVELAKDLANFANTLRDDVLVRKRKPAAIFNFVAENKPQAIRQQLFNNEFELIRHIAKNIMPEDSCYWGISLEPFRRGEVTAANYQESSVVPPCDSPEVSSQTSAIASGVVSNHPPCRIISSLDSAIVHDVSGLMRFIARVTRPSDRCYWGYDLNAIRSKSQSDDDLNNAAINPVLVTTLRLSFPSPNHGLYAAAKTMVCSFFKICTNDAWVNFILCMTNPVWTSVTGSCAGIPNADGCHITTNTYTC